APDDNRLEIRIRGTRRKHAEGDPDEPERDRSPPDPSGTARHGPDTAGDCEEADEERHPELPSLERRGREEEREHAEEHPGARDLSRRARDPLGVCGERAHVTTPCSAGAAWLRRKPIFRRTDQI